MPFEFQKLDIPGLVLVTPKIFPDARGFLMEAYKLSDFHKNGITDVFVQDIYSHSVQNVVRGLHFQIAPRAQAKLVRVTEGEIFDVAVDLRSGSKTFGHWGHATLSWENRQMLHIPAGFAHGFCVLSSTANIHYKTTEEYAPEFERGVRWNDPGLDISWPVKKAVLSDKDAALPCLKDILYELLF